MHARLLAIDNTAPNWTAAAGGNLFGLGEDDTAEILYDIVGAPGEATGPKDKGVEYDVEAIMDRLRGRQGFDPAEAEAGAPTLPRVSSTEKGSLLVLSKIELRWDETVYYVPFTVG